MAAVIAAVALLWLGSSVAGLRSTTDEQSCRSEVDNMRWMLQELAQRSGSTRGDGWGDLPPADVDLLVDMARGCGADRYAEVLERLYADDDGEDGRAS